MVNTGMKMQSALTPKTLLISSAVLVLSDIWWLSRREPVGWSAVLALSRTLPALLFVSRLIWELRSQETREFSLASFLRTKFFTHPKIVFAIAIYVIDVATHATLETLGLAPSGYLAAILGYVPWIIAGVIFAWGDHLAPRFFLHPKKTSC